MDPVTVGLLIGLSTLVVERLFSVLMKVKKSHCCGKNGLDIEMKDSTEIKPPSQ